MRSPREGSQWREEKPPWTEPWGTQRDEKKSAKETEVEWPLRWGDNPESVCHRSKEKEVRLRGNDQLC